MRDIAEPIGHVRLCKHWRQHLREMTQTVNALGKLPDGRPRRVFGTICRNAFTLGDAVYRFPFFCRSLILRIGGETLTAIEIAERLAPVPIERPIRRSR